MKKIFAWFFLATFTISLTPAYPITPEDKPLWMRYPVITPDGNTIVFTYKGDLYKVASSGGEAQPLTVSDSYEYMPVISPDGKTVVFASDRAGNFDLYSIPLAGGASTRLTFHSSNDAPYSFSPDGSKVYFSSNRLDHAAMSQFPYGGLGELYEVNLTGGRERQTLSIAAEDIQWNKSGTKMIFHDRKGYEDPMRKHHQSSVARDLWLYDKSNADFKQLTDFAGEDRAGKWSSDEQSIFYLSEKSGSFNVWKMNVNNPTDRIQISKFEKNPVRFLSLSSNNTLCYGYDGEIYTQKEGETPKLVSIQIRIDEHHAPETNVVETSGADYMAVSPNGKEIAFILHGEVFVTATETGATKRITNTPETERNIAFSPDGKALLYSSERNNIWGIYQTKIKRSEERYFYASTLLEEEALIVTKNESFQPAYSPDGKEIAYLENRTAVNIYNIATKKTRTVLPANRNYSYADGDQSFNWSPDSKYLLVSFLQDGNWNEQLGLIDVSGTKPMRVLTQNGFSNGGAKFQMNGKAILWFSNRNGMKNVASHGSQQDAYALFLSQEAFDVYEMNKTDYAIWKENNEKEEKKDESKSTDKKDPKKGPKKEEQKEEVKPLKIDEFGLENRQVRLTDRSSFLGDAFLSHDGENLYFVSSFEEGFNLYVKKIKEGETKVLSRINARGISDLSLDQEGKFMFGIVNGNLTKIDLQSGEQKNIAFKAEYTRNGYAERAYLFEHIWRQVTQKFYRTDLQGVDWNYYKTVYAKYLPHISNNRDFAEMASEMLGELNASHTGCFYRPQMKNADQTAQLGAYFDESYTGKGLKITEVMERGPLVSATTKIKAGVIIEKINGTEILPDMNYYPLLNRLEGKYTLLSLFDPTSGSRWEETVKPISMGEQGYYSYLRWVKRMQAMTEKYSGGKLGYMHVKGMDDESFREFYDQVMGKYFNKEALIVDTRFNGGGWLHDDLATFLSGKQYINFVPREQKIGIEPSKKWSKPSVVLMGEGNYSDAHMFPVVYKTLGIGKLVGMPVPGTGTAVWWENLNGHDLVFGIPEVGVMTMDGAYYENNQCEPDVKIANDYKTMLLGEDAQLKKAVEVLLAR